MRSINEFEAKQIGRALSDVDKIHQAVIPATRYGTVEEFAAATAFLCSAEASPESNDRRRDVPGVRVTFSGEDE
ncbi:MAG: hypothetical protein ABIU95_07950 [Burkholderiales bacterium]